MFKTFEEIQKKHPIGSVYRTQEVTWSSFCPDEEDRIAFEKECPNGRNFRYDNETKYYKAEVTLEYRVDAYLFDGEEWYLTVLSPEGWETVSENEINV